MRIGDYSPDTIDSYVATIKRFHIFFQEENEYRDKKEIHEITTNDLIIFSADLKKQKSTSRSINQRLMGLKKFYKFLEINDYFMSIAGDNWRNPFNKMEMPKYSNKKNKEILNDDEVKQIVEYLLDKPQWSLLVKVLIGTGIRISEALNLKYSNFKEGRLEIIGGKGNKDRTIPLSDNLCELVQEYKKHTEQLRYTISKISNQKDKNGNLIINNYVFITKNGKPIDTGNIHKFLQKVAVKLKIYKQVSCHIFRHYFCVYCLDNGSDIRDVSLNMGHKSIQTTTLYDHRDTDKRIQESSRFIPQI